MNATRLVGRRGFLAGAAAPQALIVPLFREFQTVHLINTYWALVLPQVPAPIAVFIFKKFFDGIPIQLEQAAEVDGASWWTSYRKIAMPLARPAIAAVAIFTFVWTWNNFLWPFLAATSQTMMTIPAGIGTVVSGVGIVNALQMASAVLGALPLVFVFLLAQRHIVEGVAGTGLK
ncbi:MAG TPA: carbohydrate ABC transporter permease [Streptosporangiaceae bacterium]